ncbi:MAG: flagellar biosynthesis anti-sigma factor FlgM [Limnochordia bacterium]|jgi:flagellar biosynthesis anti-sigma factor FlgM|nr:flagellar biosynthesis anti-sigma factor FlgM [Limnochordia bacterium]MDD2629917.1 flagellar biosynthesis anti-sigma factor FlgM [Limnochordia bacterium]MDD4516936.1 flagellar biosynthesis anti-sigma factor FlgM [Limnochordia bacterium]
MKVEKTTLAGVEPIAQRQALSKGKPNQRVQEQNSDRVSISEGAKRLLAKTPATSVDESGKVEAIKEKVDAGKYILDPEKIAGSIIDFFR